MHIDVSGSLVDNGDEGDEDEDGFYRTRKDRGAVSSSYSYECKECTIKRIIVSRMTTRIFDKWEYPDW